VEQGKFGQYSDRSVGPIMENPYFDSQGKEQIGQSDTNTYPGISPQQHRGTTSFIMERRKPWN
jgi:hypothetical protein